MTPSNDPLAPVPVTQADRQAAANYLSRRGEMAVPGDYRRYVYGRYDASDTVVAFARHRAQADAEATERAAKLCESVADAVELEGFGIDAHELRLVADTIREGRYDLARELADAAAEGGA